MSDYAYAAIGGFIVGVGGSLLGVPPIPVLLISFFCGIIMARFMDQ